MDLDDLSPPKRPAIIIGENLDLLSVAELEHRITILESEIGRLREAISHKQAGKAAADAVFRR